MPTNPSRLELWKRPWFWLVVATAVVISTEQAYGYILLMWLGYAFYSNAIRKRERTKAARAEMEAYAQSRGFAPTRTFAAVTVDEAHQLWGYTMDDKLSIYRYQDIVNSEVVENGDSVMTGGASLGRGLVGGLLFGPIGAIVGGSTGKRRSSQVINKLQVKVTVADFSNPVVFIDMLSTKGLKADSKAYLACFESAQRLLGAFALMQNLAANSIAEGNRPMYEQASGLRRVAK